ncbi:MAG: ActS/PrrB/RegB family redox-sensitive histidine kinase [Amaricoccus sp.]|uniref:sensor histidine kinase RegB n=1 Tax=Amaricoccus sp. TaxID=1872485 RepID=UPI0039E25A84
MAESSYAPFPVGTRRSWVRLRTLTLLRWLAVIGQTATVLFATLALGIKIPHVPCALVILASALFNAVGMAVAARSRRLREREALYMLLFDLCQLGALLYLTGGLGNPFALLLMAPVTISASVLSLRATLFLGAVAATIITLLVWFYVPLELATGEHLTLSPVVAAGTWTALLTGTIFLAIGARRVTGETLSMSEALAATQLALAREQQLSTIGGVVAAAAHELGTPLATIKLASTELVEELAHLPHLQEDAALVRAQAIRCTQILRAMGPRGKQDLMVRSAPLSSVVEEAAAPHAGRGIRVITRVEGGIAEDAPDDQPQMLRRPEIVQGLRNLVQNAVDFAATTVWIDLDWTEREIRVAIGDDGPGYPPDLIGRIGDPFVRRRSRLAAERPAYEGMGLGLFIAKTLLERSGARLDFRNAELEPGSVPDPEAPPPEFARPTGAVVTVTWPRPRVAPEGVDAVRGQAHA